VRELLAALRMQALPITAVAKLLALPELDTNW
jgi:hypothetical protein